MIRDEAIPEAEHLEDPFGVIIMDGYIHRFYISERNRNIEMLGSNIGYCKDDYAHCLHSAFMLDPLERVGSILVPLGVYPECFQTEMYVAAGTMIKGKLVEDTSKDVMGTVLLTTLPRPFRLSV